MVMRSLAALVLVSSVLLVSIGLPGLGTPFQDSAEMLAARQARDSADVDALRRLIEGARGEAERANSAQAFESVAQMELWLCEAGHVRGDNKVVKEGAEKAAAAAERAEALDPNSSEGHRLTAESLAQLIPHVFAGGPRLGPRSTREADKAIELDPKNVNAYTARAYNYFFAPKAFGGNHEKAAEMLKKAIELDPRCDTAHVWLAQVYLADGLKQDARREIDAARQIDPGRRFTQYVYKQVTGESG
jgi:tetratricopeptide (TPR) repeat protein